MKKTEDFPTKSVILKEPRLAPLEKLYLKAWLVSLSDSKALRAVAPSLRSFPSVNKYSKLEAIQYHKNKALLLKAEAISISSEDILSLLLQEATRLGPGSSPTARVQAMSLLGKHLGLFIEDNSSKNDVTFNIVNYQSPDLSKTSNLNKTSSIPGDITPLFLNNQNANKDKI